MGRTKQEILADLVWRYVEEVRTAESSGYHLRFTREELTQLAEALETAGQVPAALEGAETEACRSAVRDRLHRQLAHPPAAASLPQGPRARTSFGAWLRTRTVPAWTLAGAVSSLAVLVVALGSVNAWHHPKPVFKVRTVVSDKPNNVQSIDEPHAHELIPMMVKNELDPADERSLMWHMLLCPGCFQEYVVLKRSEHSVRELRKEFTQLVRR